MPPARSAASAARGSRTARAATGSRTRSRPRKVASRGPRVRVRWDRVGRIGLLAVLIVVVGLYVKQGLSLLSTRAQAEQQLAIVHRLSRQNAQLNRERAALSDPATIERAARALGMVKTGERPYVVTGLPNR